MPELLTDGNLSFSGGMDSSRYPSQIGEDQYHRGCNCELPRSGGGVRNRKGIHHVTIDFKGEDTKKIYESGHVQAEGWFNDGLIDFLVVAVSGYIIRLKEVIDGKFEAELINRGNRNNEFLTKGWFTRVPFGVIYNDGESQPWFISSKCAYHPDKDFGIGIGLMGVYVQNRFYYVTPDAKEIHFSDFRDPLGRTEAINANIRGFVVPEDEDRITAIGKQKAMLNYTEGGVLVFSTADNIYSVDVRGDIQDWELQSTNQGKVQESIRGIGAASSYSFESANTNLFFRSRDYGICDIRRTQYQFTNLADFGTQSIEAEYWLENDTEWMLDQCYTRAFGPRVLTTIAPEFRDDGFVFWNGLMSFHPDHEYTTTRNPRRFEGIITGVRPWAITSVKSANRKHRLFIHSFDVDGINRLYQFADADYDMNHFGQRVEIEWWIETKGFSFKNPIQPKKSRDRVCKLRELNRNVLLKVSSKTEFTGEWVDYHDDRFLVGGIKLGDRGQIIPDCIKDQGRDFVVLSDEKEKDTGQIYGNLSGGSFYTRQDRFEFKGAATLDSFIRTAITSTPELILTEETQRNQSVHCYRPDFLYSIATANTTEWKLPSQLIDYPVHIRDQVNSLVPEITYFTYLQPNGIDLYLQPDGVSLYLQPV